jgi:hypothetical protein
VLWMLWLLMGFLVRLIEYIIDVDIFNGFNGGIEPTLHIESRHRVIAFKSCTSGVSGSVEGGIESILAECNSILENVFDSGPCFLNGALEFVKVRLRMFFVGNLLYYLLVGKDDGRGEGRNGQNGRDQLHIDGC